VNKQFLRLESTGLSIAQLSLASLRLLAPVDCVVSFSAPVSFLSRYLKLTFGAPPLAGATELKVAEVLIRATTLLGIGEIAGKVLQIKNMLGYEAAPIELRNGASGENEIYPTLLSVKTALGFSSFPASYTAGTGNLYADLVQTQDDLQDLGIFANTELAGKQGLGEVLTGTGISVDQRLGTEDSLAVKLASTDANVTAESTRVDGLVDFVFSSGELSSRAQIDEMKVTTGVTPAEIAGTEDSLAVKLAVAAIPQTEVKTALGFSSFPASYTAGTGCLYADLVQTQDKTCDLQDLGIFGT
jgi:hypothetical protein